MLKVGLTCGAPDGEVRLGLAYLAALNAVGLAGVILPGQCAEPSDLLAGLSGLVLCGGGDVHPALCGEEPRPGVGAVDAARDEWEMALLAAACRLDVPVLGICRGMQVMNVYFGGSIWQDLSELGGEVCHRQVAAANTAWHSVRLAGGLAEVFGRPKMWVNSLHHQGVRRLGDGLKPVAWAADGLVEGIEVKGAAYMRGVQWHPEHLAGQEPLWRDFAAACFANKLGKLRKDKC